MFHIKFKLAPSSIHGIGLFADQNLSAGELIYSPNYELDTLLTDEELNALQESEKWPFTHYGYFDQHLGKWHLAHDDIRFCNHSAKGNITLSDKGIIAKHAINAGDELLQDYSEFEELREVLK